MGGGKEVNMRTKKEFEFRRGKPILEKLGNGEGRFGRNLV